MGLLKAVIVCLCLGVGSFGQGYEFPPDFLFGASTAAFGIEGGWNAGLKGYSFWDFQTHYFPQFFDSDKDAHYNITELSEVAADSYHKYEEDVKVAKEIGLNFYRFSIAWSRIYPDANKNIVNQDGINYYNKLIDAIVAAGIIPVATLHYYDPPAFGDPYLGGAANPLIVNSFTAYADFCFSLFGDRVKDWVTFNLPYKFCKKIEGDFLGSHLPNYPTGFFEYICGHNVLLAHAKAYRLYEKKYKASQKGRVALTFIVDWYEPKTNSTEDIEAAKRAMDFTFGWFVHPLVYGDYPKRMKDTIDELSKKQNFSMSRLPKFTEEERVEIQGAYACLPISPNATYYVSANNQFVKKPTFSNDVQVKVTLDESSKDYNNLFMNTPHGFRKSVKYVYDNYLQPDISIEHGYAALKDSLEDTFRIKFIKEALELVLKLMNEDKVKINSYVVFTLIDMVNFQLGLKATSGLAQVDFKSPQKTRTLRASAKYLSEVIKTRKV